MVAEVTHAAPSAAPATQAGSPRLTKDRLGDIRHFGREDSNDAD